MPNRTVHDRVGAVVGGFAAYHLASELESHHRMVEIAGGVLGGFAGSRLPDLIDPPTHPGHRSLGHGVLPVGGAVSIGVHYLDWLQQELRTIADDHADAGQRASSEGAAGLYTIISLLCRLLAGAAAGAIAGYASHLLLDATTHRGLPLIR